MNKFVNRNVLRMSEIYAPTLKEDPSDADIVSAKLLARAGMIRKEAAGLYTFLPLGLRVIHKIENIVRILTAARKCSCPSFSPLSCGIAPVVGTHTALRCCASSTVMTTSSALAPRMRKSSPTW